MRGDEGRGEQNRQRERGGDLLEHTHMHTHTHTHTHTHKHVHVHTHTHKRTIILDSQLDRCTHKKSCTHTHRHNQACRETHNSDDPQALCFVCVCVCVCVCGGEGGEVEGVDNDVGASLVCGLNLDFTAQHNIVAVVCSKSDGFYDMFSLSLQLSHPITCSPSLPPSLSLSPPLVSRPPPHPAPG